MKNMKRTSIISVFLAAALGISTLAGCGQAGQGSKNSDSGTAAAQNQGTEGKNSDSGAEGAVTVTSIFGSEEKEITYEKAPERVVSLAGFSTEMLLALGLEDKIVGYAWQDNDVLPQYQEAFSKLKSLCDPGTDPGEEVVMEAKPDIVLSWASWSEEDYFSYDNLAKKGILAYGFHSERTEGATLEDVYADFLNIGKIFRVESKAEALVSEMRKRVDAVGQRVKDKEPVSVFVCDIGSTQEQAFTAGGGLPADLIAKAGGKNIIQDTAMNWTHVSWEVISQANPDWIVIDYYTNADDVQGTIEFLKTQPALKELDAVKNERFITLGLADISASERNDDTVELLASYFHPES